LCKVCRKTTLSSNGKPLKNVLICDDCEAEVHLRYSSFKTMPSEDESFHCESCASKRLAAPQVVASEISSVPTPPTPPAAAAATTRERVGATAREFYNLSGDDPDLYDAQNCMALVEMEWVHSKKQYRIANDVVRMLDTKLASL
jgi:DNA-directed RNA polymerase subunit RPC12/RpoP